MARNKDPKPPRQGKMNRYTKLVTAIPTAEAEMLSQPSTAAILAAINSSRETLEGRIGELGFPYPWGAWVGGDPSVSGFAKRC